MKSQWEQSEIVKRYAKRRHQEFELVTAERYFLPDALKGMRNMLDVGCASGGMFNMIRQMGNEIPYTGIDFSRPSIQNAQELYGHDATFIQANAHQIPFPNFTFSFVHTRGLMPHIRDWKKVLHELLRVTRMKLLIDMRFSSTPSMTPYSIASTADPVDFYTVSQDEFYDAIPSDIRHIKRYDRPGFAHRGVRQILIEATMLLSR